MRLCDCKIGDSAKIVRVNLEFELKNHLYNLGFFVGNIVKIMQKNQKNGVFCVNNAIFGLNNDVTQEIEVEMV